MIDLMDTWQQQLRQAIKDTDTLLDRLQLKRSQLPNLCEEKYFPLLAPESWVLRMEAGNPNDPLLLQTLPQAVEYNQTGHKDPLAEHDKNPLPGLLHKYHGRVLLTLTGACPIHCRYCFRRHFDYADNSATTKQQQAILDYINAHPDVSEVILSGGDPLSWSDDKLKTFIDKLGAINRLKLLRIHTRYPIILPDRITAGLLDALNTHLQVSIVIHCNHPQELDANTGAALAMLHKQGIHLFNQSVLLKGINDCSKTLEQLSYKLFKQKVTPYYLHKLDPVEGALHFHVEDKSARGIIEAMRTHLPGYLMPRWVEEVPGKPYKVPL